MPVVNFIRDAEGNYPWLDLELACLMSFPKDPAKHDSALATLVLNRRARLAGPQDVIEAPAMQLLAALHGPGLPAIVDQMAASDIQGQMAGDLLIRLIQKDEAGLPALVRRERASQAADWTAATRNGKKVKAGSSTLRDAWSEFSPVAHFWAAKRYAANITGPEAIRGLIARKPISFIAVAMEILSAATRIPSEDSSGKRTTVMDEEEAWTAPSDLLRMSLKDAWIDLLA